MPLLCFGCPFIIKIFQGDKNKSHKISIIWQKIIQNWFNLDLVMYFLEPVQSSGGTQEPGLVFIYTLVQVLFSNQLWLGSCLVLVQTKSARCLKTVRFFANPELTDDTVSCLCSWFTQLEYIMRIMWWTVSSRWIIINCLLRDKRKHSLLHPQRQTSLY